MQFIKIMLHLPLAVLMYRYQYILNKVRLANIMLAMPSKTVESCNIYFVRWEWWFYPLLYGEVSHL